MRVIISAGGTGGHLYPALALAENLASRDKDNKILFITGAGEMEKQLVEEAGYVSRSIDAPGIRRKISIDAVRAALKIAKAAGKAADIIKQFKPEAVIGFGGAVTYPVIKAAHKAGIPTVIQEQNVVPGLANRYLSRLADAVAVAGDEAMNGWPKGRNIRVTGNPIRIERLEMPRADARRELNLSEGAKVVTVFGGSQGAKHINETIVAAYSAIDNIDGIELLHITGRRDFDETVKSWSSAGASAKIKLLPYLDGMGAAYRASDLVVCRAGASTLAELGVYGVPAVIIPYPYASGDHQAKNAAEPLAAGAAIVINDDEIDPDIIARTIGDLLGDTRRLKNMAASMRGIGRPNAANDLANLVIEVAGKVK